MSHGVKHKTFLLSKKKWHVGNRDNVERVEKDQREHAEKEAELERRKAYAEQEARLNLLRSKRRAELGLTEDDHEKTNVPELTHRPASQTDLVVIAAPPAKLLEHVNLFADVEAGLDKHKKVRVNPEHEEERKKEEAKYGVPEMALGEFAKEQPWYSGGKGDPAPDEAKVKYAKAREDPLRDIMGYLGKPIRLPPPPNKWNRRIDRVKESDKERPPPELPAPPPALALPAPPGSSNGASATKRKRSRSSSSSEASSSGDSASSGKRKKKHKHKDKSKSKKKKKKKKRRKKGSASSNSAVDEAQMALKEMERLQGLKAKYKGKDRRR